MNEGQHCASERCHDVLTLPESAGTIDKREDAAARAEETANQVSCSAELRAARTTFALPDNTRQTKPADSTGLTLSDDVIPRSFSSNAAPLATGGCESINGTARVGVAMAGEFNVADEDSNKLLICERLLQRPERKLVQVARKGKQISNALTSFRCSSLPFSKCQLSESLFSCRL